MYRACAVIHPSAQIHAGADIAEDVRVGAFSIIGEHVRIGRGTRIAANVIIEGHTSIGCDNELHPFSVIGGPPQDKKYAGEATRLEIGDRNTIREFCTFNRGTAQGEGVTRIGDDNLLMAYVHLAHDCQVGNHTIFANNSQLAGHVHVDDHAILGGFTVVHQFVSIGAHSLTAMGTILLQDLPPYVLAAGNSASPHGINSKGLKRRGFTTAAIVAIRTAYKTLYRSGLSLDAAQAQLEAQARTHPEVALFPEFLARNRRAIIR